MFSRIFIDRPRLAMVVSIVITLAGLISLFNIPVAQYPEITPPEIQVTAVYPGANAKVVADSVAAPIEKEVNGVDDMLYMSSTSSNNGLYTLSVTFAVGTDPDIDQVNLQNRVQLATPKLPRDVVNQGISVRKRSSNMMAAVGFFSPGGTRSKLFLSNYVSRNVKDVLVRLEGVSDVFIFGELEYSMRIWMDPDKLTARGLTADDVIAAIRRQNVQAAVGSIGTSPADKGQQIQYTLRSKGRLDDPKEFERIIVRANDEGGLVRVGDVAGVELGAKSYGHQTFLNGSPALGMAIYRTPGANTMETMKEVRAELERLAERAPKDVEYKVILDTTRYVSAAIREIELTLLLTFLLVLFVNYVFLQDWRATLVPTATIPVSLIGTFAVLMALGYSANTISLFALIMAIGLVVDDAIVVVENVFRLMQEENLPPREAAIRSMGQVTGPIVATTLVLLAVFVPVGFMPGITGQLYKQFAVTICTAVVISSINALTLSPALCAVLLKKPGAARRGPFTWFNKTLGAARSVYTAGAGLLVRRLAVAGALFLCVLGGAWFLFDRSPTSFLPEEDQGYFFVNVQLPEGASLPRTNRVMQETTRAIQGIGGIDDVIAVSGFSLMSGIAENVGFGIAVLKPWDERKRPDLAIEAIVGQAQARLAALSAANIFCFAPPPIRGLGITGGFDFRLQALEDQPPREIAAALMALVGAANRDPALMRVFSTYTADTPQIYVNLDRTRAETLGVPVSRVFAALQEHLGSSYVNDFTLYGRVYQVKVQAKTSYRDAADDIERLYVRSDKGGMVPLKSIVTLSTVLGPQLIYRYNQFTSVQVNGGAAPGRSSGEAMAAMEGAAKKTLPEGFSFDWSTMSFQERKAGGKVGFLFLLALVFGYLFLVGQYESWTIPLSIILSIPVASLGALAGLWIVRLPLSIYAQIGLVLLVGLAAKNAILIVEFARDRRREGLPVIEAAVEGARIRFRPVLMTAFTFILGVLPLVIATGAGAGSRRAIGTTVFSGMLAATVVGIFFVPALYRAFQSLAEASGGRSGRRGGGDGEEGGEGNGREGDEGEGKGKGAGKVPGKVLPVLLAALFLALGGCAAVGPDYEKKEPKAPEKWHTGLKGGLTAGKADPETLARWWKALEDEELESFVERAAKGNLDLKEARARIREARALRGVARAGLFPTLDASGLVQKSRASGNGSFGAFGAKGVDTLYSAGFDAAWELDVFGGTRRAVEAAQADLEAAEEELRDVLVSLLAEVALNYVEVRTFQVRLTAVEANIAVQEKTYELNRSRYEAGIADELAVKQSLYNLERTRSQAPILRAGLEAAKNRLAVLLGERPGAVHEELAETRPIPVPPVTVTVGIPAEVLRRRPDVRAAERALAAQTARVGAATAELYPKFRLNGSIGLESLSSGSFWEWASRTWSIGPSFSWNIFHGGAVRRNIEVQNARQEQALIRYESAVLRAQEEVEDALSSYAEEMRRRESLAAAAKAASRAVDLARHHYDAGLVDFSTVLDAQRSLQTFQDELAQSEGAVTSNLVKLYKALGGGWEGMGKALSPPR